MRALLFVWCQCSMPDLPCPAKDRKGDQGQRKRDEEFRATIAVRSDVIQGGQIVKWTEIPDQ